MLEYPVPSNELRRLDTLTKTGVLTIENNDCFDRITRIACRLFDVPVAMINFITADEDVNKSCFGMQPGGRNDRRISFCSYTILSDEPLIIGNASEHDHFKENPHVKGGMNIKAYAGVPLKAPDNTNPGALCLVDTRPRNFSDDEIGLLKDLAHWAELELSKVKVCATD